MQGPAVRVEFTVEDLAFCYEMAMLRRRHHIGRPEANERISAESDDAIDYQGVIGELALRRYLGVPDDDPGNLWEFNGPDPGWDIVWETLKIDVKTSKGPKAKNLQIADYKILKSDVYVPVLLLGEQFRSANIMGCISRRVFLKTHELRTYKVNNKTVTSKCVPYVDLSPIEILRDLSGRD